MEFFKLILANLTRITSLIVVLLMASVWAYLSIKTQMMQPVSENFLMIGGLLIAGEIGAGIDIVGRLNKKIDGGTSGDQNKP